MIQQDGIEGKSTMSGSPWTGTLTMKPHSWGKACELALDQLGQQPCGERVAKALSLAQNGCVTLQDESGESTALVRSNNAQVTYVVSQGSCTCPDAHYRRQQCKHQLAALLAWHAARIVHAGVQGL